MKLPYQRYLFVPALIFLTAGILVFLLGERTNVGILLLSIGILCLVLWLEFLFKSQHKFWGLRSTEATTNAIISTVAVIIIFGLVNFLAARYSVRIDFTENQLFTLSPQSQEIIANLPQDLKVYVFDSQPNPQDKELLESYARNSSKFSFEFVDPQVNLALTREFNLQRLGEVHLKSGEKKQLVQVLSPNSRLSEIELTNAIAKVQRERQPIVYFLQGHGEPPLEGSEGSFSQAVASLTDRGYRANPLNLATSPLIPPDADLVVVASGERELLAGEVEALKKYADSGGSLLILLNASIETGLSPLLQEWGIILDGRLVVDASGTGEVFGLGPATTLITDYGAHPITEDFGKGISMFPLARAIMTKPVEGVEAIALLISSDQTWAESDREAEEVELNLTEDIPGPLDIGVALVRKLETEKSATQTTAAPGAEEANEPENQPQTPEESTLPNPPDVQTPEEGKTPKGELKQVKSASKMVAIGNANFATNGWFQQQLNGDLLLNSIGWLTDDGVQNLSIRPKEPKNRRLNLTNIDAGIISWLAILIVPALGFFAASVTWWKRSR